MKLFSFLKRKPKVIVVCGPTATGKTSLAIEIAELVNGEVISADSRQVYRGLDIGSAKITREEMRGIPHHMIDVADPREAYSVQQFVDEANRRIADIISRKKVPIICGGTGMYIDALVSNQTFPEVPPNPTLRAELESLGKKKLYEQLIKEDRARASTIDKDNKVRLIRALEIVRTLGKVPKIKKEMRYHTLFIGLKLPKDILEQNIAQRITERLEQQDMLGEAKGLHKNGLSFKRMEALGLEYRYMARHLQGKISYQEMVEQLTQATKQFAKRQMTWFKRNKNIHWFDPVNDKKVIVEYLKKFL